MDEEHKKKKKAHYFSISSENGVSLNGLRVELKINLALA